MKKWIALLALMCLCTVSGCTKKETPRSPAETTAAFLNGIQNQDSDAVKASSDWKDFNIKAFSVDDSDYMDSVDKKLTTTADVWMVSSANAQLEKLLSANLNLLQEQ